MSTTETPPGHVGFMSSQLQQAATMGAAPPVQPPEVLPVKKPAAPSQYMVLGQDQDGDWVECGQYPGTSRNAAIRAFVGDEEHGYTAYEAVPRWNPVKVLRETKTITKFGSAS